MKIFLPIIILFSINFQAQEIQQSAKLFPSDGAYGFAFGTTLALYQDIAVVGAPSADNGDISLAGAVYVYKFENGIWIESQRLTASDGQSGDWFGYSVAIYGNTIVVGAVAAWNADPSTRRNSAYIFEFENDIWVEKQIILGSNSFSNTFGDSVAISENSIVISSNKDNDGGIESGSVYAYKYDGESWVENQRIKALNPLAGANFGKSIAISEDKMIIGAYGHNDSEGHFGSAYIFEKENNLWIEKDRLYVSDSDEYKHFGRSVAISGNRVIVGVLSDEVFVPHTGDSYIFDLIGGEWQETQKLTILDFTYDFVRMKVGLFGDVAVVSVFNSNNEEFNDSGSAYIYQLETNGWTEVQSLVPSDGIANDFFGYSVSIYQDRVLVGAKGSVDNNVLAGATYVFDITTNVGIDESFSDLAISVSPNPSNGTISISSNDLISSISIYSIHGKLILNEEKIVNNKARIHDLENGVYIVTISKENNSHESIRIVIN